MPQSNAFQLRLQDGSYNVYMIRVNGTSLPRDRQRFIFGSPVRARAQLVSDALNNGLLTRILLAMQAAATENRRTG